MDSHYQYFATAPKGLTGLLREELLGLGASNVKETVAGVAFCGDLCLAYTACLWSRLANRVLLPLHSFQAADENQLYDGVYAIDWHEHFTADNSILVNFNSTQSAISHTQFGAQKTKDAIVDKFLRRDARRPNVDKTQPDIRIDVYVHKNHAVVSLDLSGESLHKRGYRLQQTEAPLKENLAAAMLLRAKWPEIAARGGSLIDPMCGSGTLLVEAALLAYHVAPGLLRERFGFNSWRQHDEALWQQVKNNARQRQATLSANPVRIFGYDKSETALRVARENIARAGFQQRIHLELRDLHKFYVDHGAEPGLIITNPPYGERLNETQNLLPLYQQLGQSIKTDGAQWSAAVITNDVVLMKAIGLRATRKYRLFNGKLQCELLCFTPPHTAFNRSSPSNQSEPLAAEPAAHVQTIPSLEMLVNRLNKNLKHIGRWARKQNIDCYRVYDSDLPEFAFAIDLYGAEQRYAQVQEFAAPASVAADKAEQRRNGILAVLPQVLQIPPDQVFYKLRTRQKGDQQYRKQAESASFVTVRENNLLFRVNFQDYLDTGLFLDHRDTRRLIQQLTLHQHFLNLYCYTGSASVYAAAGGASSTTSVDLSANYLDWAKQNFQLNGMDLRKHEFVRADCLLWLEQQQDKNRRFGVIFIDPPTFSNSKRMEDTFDVQRDHVRLLRAAARLLTPNGVIIFSNNFSKFKLDYDALADFFIEDISLSTIPKDFERRPNVHRCWKISRPKRSDSTPANCH